MLLSAVHQSESALSVHISLPLEPPSHNSVLKSKASRVTNLALSCWCGTFIELVNKSVPQFSQVWGIVTLPILSVILVIKRWYKESNYNNAGKIISTIWVEIMISRGQNIGKTNSTGRHRDLSLNYDSAFRKLCKSRPDTSETSVFLPIPVVCKVLP